VTLPEDMGILSSFAKNLNNIKKGFKVAVEQEVKSQILRQSSSPTSPTI